MFYLKKLAESKCNIKNSKKILYLKKKIPGRKYNIKIFEKILYWEKLPSTKCNIRNLEKIFYLKKKILNQKWNVEKTLYIEKNLLLKWKMKTKYFIKGQTWKKFMK